jgi:hypothetical protein
VWIFSICGIYGSGHGSFAHLKTRVKFSKHLPGQRWWLDFSELVVRIPWDQALDLLACFQKDWNFHAHKTCLKEDVEKLGALWLFVDGAIEQRT